MKRKFFKVLLGVFILANLGIAEYVKKDNEIYYKYGKEDDSGFKVENVDLNTFKILDDKYAKDSKNVYFLGNKSFEDVDIKTFEVLPNNYSKDNNNVYRPNNEWIRKINGANPKTIKVLSQYYSKDDKNVFYDSDKILNADINSFVVLEGDHSHAKDKNSVYYSGEKIEGANPKTFKIISDGMYSKDDKNVYVAREIVKGADPQTFRRIPETNYARDKNTLYYYFGDVKNLGKINEKDFKVLDNNLVKNGNEMYYLGEKVNIKNPEKFEPIKISDDKYILYGKDDENIYVVTSDEKYGYFKAIKNADKDTFEVMEKDTRYSKDKNNVYYAGYNVVQLQDVDKDSFVIADENAFSYDKKNVYYAGRKLNDISSNGFKVTRLDNRPNLPINFLNDNKNIYKLIDIFDEETGELKSVKTAVVKNPKVDSKTFELFDHWENYFRDKNNVYYENELYKMSLKKIEGADRNSFKILNSDEFSKDKNNVYYYGNKMKDISPDGLEFVGNEFVFENREDFISFLKDKNNVYYLKGKIGKEKYEIIPLNFDSKTFKYSNNGFYELSNLNYTGYFEDKNGVYYFDGLAKLTPNNILSKVENADIPSFVQYMAGYAKDKNKVYCGTKEVKGADVESFAAFTIDGEDIIKDKNKIYKYTNSCEQ
ncbi:DKNYY domain-containing protein [Leptotrichia sp. HSP-536]|uniref:DKNYY domain-containing protein n=1 Tax=Leptotrichia alba TaxID=3239304 RepID=A0AB39V7I3_9FUSO